MPLEVKGLTEFQKELKRLAPDLHKEMKITWKTVLSGVAQKAKGFIPSSAPRGLEQWGIERPTHHKVGVYGAFPKWDSRAAKAGITYRTTKSRANYYGFVSYMRIRNKNAIGAIYETAGRKNPNGAGGTGKYASDNPNAGAHFVRRIQNGNPLVKAGERPTDRKGWGRVIFKAWAEDKDKATAEIIRSIEHAKIKLEARMASSKREVIK